MMNKNKIICLHVISFMTMTIALFMWSETLLDLFTTGFYTARERIDLVIFGILGIAMLTIFSCLIFLEKYNQQT